MNKLIVAALLALSATSANAGTVLGECKTISPNYRGDGRLGVGEDISASTHVIRNRPDDKAQVVLALPNNLTVDVSDRYVNNGKTWLWVGANFENQGWAQGWARLDTLKECDLKK